MRNYPTCRSGSLETFIHLLVWIFLFGLPHMMMMREGIVQPWYKILYMLGAPLLLAGVFYLNYLVLAPRLLLRHKIKRYLSANIATMITAFVLLQGWFWTMDHLPALAVRAPQGPATENTVASPRKPTDEQERTTASPSEPDHAPAPHKGAPHNEKGQRQRPDTVSVILFRLRDLMLYAFAAALAAVIQMSRQWHRAELRRKKAELKQTETELQSLRNQINPHFLLNTLNNIYALIAFDTEKAQQAVLDLSKLLRHLLYENKEIYTDLNKEIEFLRNYVELMRIRLSEHIELDFQTDVPPENNLRIAPLIFISLIENAFKHGISPTAPSFIRIHIEADPESGRITCRTCNSNFPKRSNDISGSGVGLKQVQRRLDLIYPHHYRWDKGVDNDTSCYHSVLTIETTP